MSGPLITAKELRKLFDYNEASGKFFRGSGIGFGREVGSPQTRGYLKIKIAGKHYLAHRLAWLYVHGEWPPEVIDHINGNTSDNRIINLRAVSQRENSWNRKEHRERDARGA